MAKQPSPRPGKPKGNPNAPRGKGKGQPKAQAKGQKGQSDQPKPKGRRKAVGVREELQELKEVGALKLWFEERLRETPGWVTSMIVHAVIIILLALITIAPDIDEIIPDLLAMNDSEETEELEELEDNIEINDEIEMETDISELVETDNIQEEMEISDFDDAPAAYEALAAARHMGKIVITRTATDR